MYNKLFVVCLLLAVAAELIEGKSTFHKRNTQKNSRRSHFQVIKRQSECSSDQFLCVNTGRCIPDGWVCDSDNDCGDGSDEPEDCLTRDCPEGYWKCSNGQCLNTTSYCTGDVRCRGEGLVVSDADCPPVECGADQFACGGVSKCVPRKYVCDRNNDCGDGSDEQNCDERVCAHDEVRCQSGQCLSKLYFCVLGLASPSCRDGSTPSFTCLDFTCPSEGNYFQCVSNGKCVSNSVRCDGYEACNDGSDEADCPPVQCEPGYARCPTINKCISTSYFCDTYNDCGDNSDEQNCVTRDCPEGYVKCSNGQCLNTTSYCTGDVRCRGEALVVSDADCPLVECGSDQFACGSGRKCVPKAYVCDRDNDCGDRSDEESCEERVCADDEVRCQSGQCINKLSYCMADWKSPSCRDGSTPSFSCHDFTCPSEDNYFRCVSNGKCVSNSSRCDGNNNCHDGSDEDDCPPVQCKPGYARCPTRNKCIFTSYFCDTYNDCGDNSDEQNCDERVCADDEVRCQSGQCLSKLSFCTSSLSSCRGGSSPIVACTDFTCPEDNHFQCVSNGECVWNSSRCDGINNCDDGSEEADCQGVESEPEPDFPRTIPVRYMCMMSIERECPAPNLEQHFVGLRYPGDVFSKLAQTDLREICTPLQEFGNCAGASFDNSTYCQDTELAPDLRLMREFGPRVLNYVCEENVEVINREKSCLLKLNEQNQPVMMFKLMMSCAPYLIALQSSSRDDVYCISAELQQCAKNAIAEECGDDIATVANGLADLVQDFCKETQTLRSAPSADPVEQPSYQTYMKRHVRDFSRVRKLMKSIF